MRTERSFSSAGYRFVDGGFVGSDLREYVIAF